jgi:hypothetical protein
VPSPPGGENAGVDEQVLQLAKQLMETGFPEAIRAQAPGDHGRRQANSDQPGRVNRTFAETHTLGDRLADHVASFGGSWTYLAMCLVAPIAWTASS